jgi:hypothetical protein
MNQLNIYIYKSLLTESNQVANLLPEFGSANYSNYIEELIEELVTFKKGLRKGPDRHKNRKEISNLQRAIESLRYFNRKNKKLLDS